MIAPAIAPPGPAIAPPMIAPQRSFSKFFKNLLDMFRGK